MKSAPAAPTDSTRCAQRGALSRSRPACVCLAALAGDSSLFVNVCVNLSGENPRFLLLLGAFFATIVLKVSTFFRLLSVF